MKRSVFTKVALSADPEKLPSYRKAVPVLYCGRPVPDAVMQGENISGYILDALGTTVPHSTIRGGIANSNNPYGAVRPGKICRVNRDGTMTTHGTSRLNTTKLR